MQKIIRGLKDLVEIRGDIGGLKIIGKTKTKIKNISESIIFVD